MKTLLKIMLIAVLSMGFLSACDRGKSKSGSGANPPPFFPNGGYSAYVFDGRAYVTSRSVYREFLKGDFCYKKRDCKWIDGNPIVSMGLQQITASPNQQIPATVRIRLTDRYGRSGGAVVSHNVVLVPTQNNTQFEGDAVDYRTPHGSAPANLKFIGRGDLSYGYFKLQVYYNGVLMLEARLQGRR